jgi:peptidoglycan/xylan/chitin deacetylase (PgdA/CDA1 family)
MQTHRLVFFGLLACGLSSCGGSRGGDVTPPSPILFGKVEPPVLNLASGRYSSAQSVAIITYHPGAVIYYTTDGSDPTTSSRVYSGPVSVTTDLTLKSMAVAKYYAQSNVASADYTFAPDYRPDSGLPATPKSVAYRIGSVDMPGGLKVVDWAGFRAAVTYTFDDASQADEYPELQATGQRMTFFLTCGWDHDPSVWLQAARDGQEIGNHTQHHCSSNGENCGAGQWAGSIEAEYDACTERLKQAYGLDNIWTTAAPYGDTGYQSVARTRFFLNRGVSEGHIAVDDSSRPYHLPAYAPKKRDRASKLNSLVDAAASGGYWRIFELHSLKANYGYAPFDIKELVANISYAKSRGDIWIDSMVNVGAYWAAQEALENAKEIRTGYGTTLRWTLPSHFPSGKYVRVIATRGTLKQGGQVIPLNESGYYEIALDPGSLTILR